MLKNNFKINKRFNNGFTLVEMLVAIAIFMIVMTVAVGSLVSIIDANRKGQAVKNVVNNINFALETISKDMRVGTEYSCFDENSYVGNCPTGGSGVKYLSGTSTVHYRYVSTPPTGTGNIQRCKKGSYTDTCSDPDWESLTAPKSNVNITNMKFYVVGTSDTKKQPRVMITLEGTAGEKDNIKTEFNIQTTVSQRSKDL